MSESPVSRWPKYQHEFKATKIDPDTKERVRVHAGLHHIRGNSRPHFFATCDIYERRGTDGWAYIGGGAAHELILKLWPELKPVTDLHLSDDLGIPMHAVANGLYHLGFGQYSALNYKHAASHFRITEEEAKQLRATLATEDGHDQDAYADAIADMVPRWHAEAEAAIRVLDAGPQS